MSDNVFGEALEQIANLPGQLASDAVKTVLGKPIQFQKVNDLKQLDKQKTQQNLAAVRSNIKSLMTPKPKPQQNPPAYISGKAGFSIEKIQKMQKLQEDQKKKPPPLPKSAQQGQGSGEIGKFVAG